MQIIVKMKQENNNSNDNSIILDILELFISLKDYIKH